MSTRIKHNHVGRNWKLWSSMALVAIGVVSVDLGSIQDAQADIRIRGRARIETPHVTIDLQHNGPRDIMPGGCVVTSRYDQRDERIALRLHRATGIRQIRLLSMRDRGFTWYEIGNRLDIHPKVMRQALAGDPHWKGQKDHKDQKRNRDQRGNRGNHGR